MSKNYINITAGKQIQYCKISLLRPPPPYIPPPPHIHPQICNPINIPNISPHRICAPPNIGPSNLPSLRNNMFTKNVTLPQVFSYISPVQFIYLVSP